MIRKVSAHDCVAVLASDGFLHHQLSEIARVLEHYGRALCVVSPRSGEISSWSGKGWGDRVTVDRQTDRISASDFEALVIPGGLMSANALRLDPDTVSFVREFFEEGKLVAALGHAPQLFVEAQVAEGKLLTSDPAIEFDLENAGARWRDEAVVFDGGLLTGHDSALEKLLVRFVDELCESYRVGVDLRAESRV